MIFSILSIAQYETKTLMRSWFFRIFALLSLIILFFYNFFAFANTSSASWSNHAIASAIPYANIFMLNIVQAIISVFLSSDFLQKDKKLDTAEVIFVRPVSNAEYILGKTFGILWVFLILNVAVLAMALVFNYITVETPIVTLSYFLYPILLSLPSLIFILGLSFLVMMLFKNQALTYVLVFGFVFVSMFFLQDKVYNLFDYLGLSLPMVYSDFVGFSNEKVLLFHRLTYFLIGAGFISLTIRLLSRLPNSSAFVNGISVLSGILILAGCYTGYRYYSYFSNLKTERTELLKSNNKYFVRNDVTVVSEQIQFNHVGHKMQAMVDMEIQNLTDEAMDTLVFSLNPGLKIESITENDKALKFKCEGAVVLVFIDQSFESNATTNLQWLYKGSINESVVALDTWWENYIRPKSIEMIKMEKRSAFLTPNYVMLTPAVLWYPISGVGYNAKNHLNRNINFTRFNLEVNCAKGLTAISQGSVEVEDQIWKFTPDNPLSGLSLIIGDYEQTSLTVESVTYNLMYLKGHDFFSNYFENLKDTLPTIISTTKADFERQLDLYYPFKRFSLVEVPCQFHSFKQQLSDGFESAQPEMVFINEKGIGLSGTDFAKAMKYESDRNRKSDNTRTPAEIETGLFLRFVNGTLFNGIPKASGTMRRSGGRSDSRSTFKGVAYNENPNSVFPLYYNHMAGFHSNDAPYFNRIVEAYLKEGFQPSFRETMGGGMTDEERANQALQTKSMGEILNDEKIRNLYGAVIKQKGNYLISLIQNKVGLADFNNFLYFYIEDHSYQNLTFQDFKKTLMDSLEFDLEPYLDQWMNSKSVASYLINDIKLLETRDDYGPVYLIKFKATNYADASGILYANMRLSGSGGFASGSSNSEERIFTFEPNETKDIQIMLYEQPRMLVLNTMISSNVPGTFMEFFRKADRIKVVPEEYEKSSHYPVTIKGANEIIVDNEDPGFTLSSERKVSKLKTFIERNKEVEEVKYRSIDRYPPSNWTAVSHTAFYGKFIRSAYYARNGSGDMSAKWTTKLPSSGTYEVYTYIPMMAMMERGRGSSQGGGRSSGGSGGGGQERGQDGPSFGDKGYVYNYKVTTADGMKELPFKLENIENGWNKIGTYYMNADSVSVELSNNISGRRVFADAIKWVKVN